MSLPNTSEKSVYLDREEHVHKGTLGAKRVVTYSYDAATDTLNPTTDADRALATRLDDSADPITYIGKAVVGSAESAAVWQIAKLDTTSGLVKTWAGNAGFTNVWEDRTSLTYI
jgi:hypothetical protein